MLNSFNVVHDDFGRFLLFLHPLWGSQFNTFVMSDQDSSKMRVSERNETCFNCRTEAVSHLQNAKTQKHKITKMQKCKKVLNQFFQLTKKTHIFCSEKRRRQTENRGCTLCEMCRKYTPKGEMGYPKWQNGIPQMAKWDTPNGEMGYPKW